MAELPFEHEPHNPGRSSEPIRIGDMLGDSNPDEVLGSFFDDHQYDRELHELGLRQEIVELKMRRDDLVAAHDAGQIVDIDDEIANITHALLDAQADLHDLSRGTSPDIPEDTSGAPE